MTLAPIAPSKTTRQNGHSLLGSGPKGSTCHPVMGRETLASQDAMNVLASHSRRHERSRVPKWAQKGSQKGPQKGSLKGSQKSFFRRFLVFYASFLPSIFHILIP